MSRIKISLGQLQIEYEGDQEFIEKRLLGFAESALSLSERLPVVVTATAEPNRTPLPNDVSTNTIAQMISANTGTDLALAAIARVNIVHKKPTATRQEILDEMKEATTYFKDSYVSNLSAYLNTLVKSKRVNLVSRSTYALAAGERSRLEQAIING